MSSDSDPASNNPFGAWLPPFLNPANMNPFAGLQSMLTPGAAGGATDVNAWMKAIDPAEIEKRIAELRVVEMWLQSQVSMVQMSIQTMTLQKQSMEALKAATQTMNDTVASVTPKTRSGAKTTRKTSKKRL
jgi:hypothetical protein